PITLLTKPASIDQLKIFYSRVRPAGPGWGPIKKALPSIKPVDSVSKIIKGWFFGTLFVSSVTVGIGLLLLGRWIPFLISFVTFLVSGYLMIGVIKKMTWGEVAGE
ncbi:MAG TPA: hypothetical protein VJL87_03510, partial [Bdellovibrionota bacterium]|nr:hypothetical protein [Bdellovibrionota bacterium]